MATFVLIEPDAFNEGFSDQVTLEKNLKQHGSGAARYYNVRRPVRGIQIKDDTYATLQVRNAQGVNILLFDAASESENGRGLINSNFLLQQVTEQRAEKQQVIQTFGEPYYFFYGEQPRTIAVSGLLLNTEDFNWRAEWWENYDRFLRGTACVRSQTRVYLSWDDIVVEGYIVSASANDVAQERHFVQFQFQMFLTNYQNISGIGDPDAHWRGKATALDPSSINLPGTGDQTSTTLAVRMANMEGVVSFGQADSLMAKLRQGEDFLMNIDGQIVNTLNYVSSFISGRRIGVPLGYLGSAAYDSEVQLALASIPGPSDPQGFSETQTLTHSRKVSLAVTGLKSLRNFQGILGRSFAPYDKERGFGPGLPLSANTDEFVARLSNNLDSSAQGLSEDLFAQQKVNEKVAMNQVIEVFRSYGIDTDPPKELYAIVAKVMFGITKLGIGMNMSKAPEVGHFGNILGTIL